MLLFVAFFLSFLETKLIVIVTVQHPIVIYFSPFSPSVTKMSLYRILIACSRGALFYSWVLSFFPMKNGSFLRAWNPIFKICKGKENRSQCRRRGREDFRIEKSFISASSSFKWNWKWFGLTLELDSCRQSPVIGNAPDSLWLVVLCEPKCTIRLVSAIVKVICKICHSRIEWLEKKKGRINVCWLCKNQQCMKEIFCVSFALLHSVWKAPKNVSFPSSIRNETF